MQMQYAMTAATPSYFQNDAQMIDCCCLQVAGDAFGTSADQGLMFKQRLLPSRVALRKPDHHLLPMPRGALTGLKLVPLSRTEPGAGEIKVPSPCCLRQSAL